MSKIQYGKSWARWFLLAMGVAGIAPALAACSVEEVEEPTTSLAETSEALSACSVRIKSNSYAGDPDYWGTIEFENDSSSALTEVQISIDVPSGVTCDDDPESWTHTQSGVRCTYSRTSSLSIAPGASYRFNYSTDSAASFTAANIEISDPNCDGGGGGSPHASKVLDYLSSISGSKTVAGQHNRKNADPTRWTREIQEVTGKRPLLWGGDFLFEAEDIRHRGTMIEEAKRQWASGALVTLMWHPCPPTMGEPCDWDRDIQSHLRDDQWNELVTSGTNLNARWKARLDTVIPYLEDLRNNGVEVLFRPVHEMNDGWSWWGGRPGKKGSQALYRITHDYLVNEKGLTNLIWVWNVKDNDIQGIQEYYPGDGYVDVASLDVYVNGYTRENYDAMIGVAHGKPISIGECQDLPSPDVLAKQPRWAWFMGWSELVFKQNPTEKIRGIYDDRRVLTLGARPRPE